MNQVEPSNSRLVQAYIDSIVDSSKSVPSDTVVEAESKDGHIDNLVLRIDEKHIVEDYVTTCFAEPPERVLRAYTRMQMPRGFEELDQFVSADHKNGNSTPLPGVPVEIDNRVVRQKKDCLEDKLSHEAGSQSEQGDQIDGLAQQLLTFNVGNRAYGLSTSIIQEIIPFQEPTPAPYLPEFILGFIIFRGATVPIIDLQKRISGISTELKKRASIVVVRHKTEGLIIDLGLVVDIVNDIVNVGSDELKPLVLTASLGVESMLKGVAIVDGTLLVVLKVDGILSVEECFHPTGKAN